MKLLYCAALAATLLAAPASLAATITVDTLEDESNTDGDCSLREAIAAANTNVAVDGCVAGDPGVDTVEFQGAITLVQSGFMITEDVVVRGLDGGPTNVIDGADSFRIFDVTSGTLALANLTVTNGRSLSGAGVFVQIGAGLATANVTFVGNTATGDGAAQGGGAVYNLVGTVALGTTTFDGNSAIGESGSGGAVLSNNGQLVVAGSAFLNNQASRAGGGIEIRGPEATTQISDTDFSGNAAGSNPGNGGALHVTGVSSSSITGGIVSDNVAALEGGGFWNNTGTMTISGVTFTGNVAQGPAADDGGGALFNNGGTMIVTDGAVTGNSATGVSGSGGGILTLGGTLNVQGTLIDGNAANRAGAGVESAGGNATLANVTVNDNDIPAETAMPGNGGGVHAGGGTLTIINGAFTANDATEGGAIWANGVLSIQATDDGETTIQGNTGRGDDASNGGGGVYVETGGDATIEGASFVGNVASGASGSGGAILIAPDAMATVTGGSITGNLANRAGAGIEVAGGTLTLVDVSVVGNLIPAETAMPGNGGGLHAGGGSVTIRGGEFVANQATEGGGVWSSGVMDISASGDDGEGMAELRDNVGRGDDATNGGGGVYAETGATVTLTDVLVSGNAATGAAGSGGGLFVADGAQMTVLRGAVRGNQANRAGGGVEVADDGDTDVETSLLMTAVTLDGNSIATPAPGNGGGLHIGGAGTVRIDMSTVSGNTAREGGGLWASGASSMEVVNSTVTGNTSTENGGGVYDNGGASVSLESVTIALNDAGGNGGGMLSQSSDAFTFTNTVVGLNTASSGADCFGSFVSGDYNLVQSTADCTFTGDTGNTITGQDPLLAPLADNGGPTLTHEPQEGSPLIDAGQTDLTVDQRGFGRSVGQDDIGSVERGAMPVAEEGSATAGALALQPARPNPARGATTLAFTVAEAGDARIELYNLLGQRVQVVFEGPVSPDAEQTVRLDVSALAPGVYVARLQSGPTQSVQRVTVVR